MRAAQRLKKPRTYVSRGNPAFIADRAGAAINGDGIVKRLLLFGPIGLALAGGCSAGTQLDERSSAVQVARTLPAPDSPTTAVDFSAYRIGPTDEIIVSVFGAPELGREGAVDAAGNFSLPLAGTVVAGGRTPEELSKEIADRLRGPYLKNPQVVVNIKTARAQTVTIDGAVREPGVYPVLGKLTLQQAIATAKGASDSANIGNVVVFRTVNGQRMAAMFNLKDVRAGRYMDPQIYGNDIVVVGESAVRRFFKDYVGAFPILGSFIPVL
jgi:polysaccharide biosynthesis/export protein